MGELIIGKGTYGTVHRRGNQNTVTIGNYCSIAGNCVCDCGWQHNIKFVSTYPFNHLFANSCGSLTGHPVCKGDINIGSDVWIGEDVIIMSNVTIGDGAVIGARSIVTKDVQPYTIVGGTPAKAIKKRFSDRQIEQLLKIQWWNWTQEKILSNAHLLMNENIDKFIELHEVK